MPDPLRRRSSLGEVAAVRIRHVLGSTLVIAGAGALAPAPGMAAPAAVPRYSIVDLGVLGSADVSVATAINNAGDVVGYSNPTASTTHAFRWTAGVLSDLGVQPGGYFSTAAAINDAGEVAGTADRTGGGYGYPVRWSADGVLTDLGGPQTNALGLGTGIDPAGRVVGGQRPASSEGAPLGTMYRVDGSRVDLGEDLGTAAGINAAGEIVGSPAYVWRDGNVRFLPSLPGGGGATATAINIGATVVGSAGTGTGSAEVAVRWRDGVPQSLGTVAGISRNRATAVNAAGQIVGTADPQCVPCVAPRAWLWQDGEMTELDGLIPAGAQWILQQANGINDRGQIVGAGLHLGRLHAFLMTPRFAATVNFQPADTAVPTGYVADTGAVYGVHGALSYGWDVDNAAYARDRNAAAAADQRYDTLTHLQKPGSATVWELAVPDGRYVVHVVAGDPVHVDSTFRLSVEGRPVVTGTPTAAAHWCEGTVLVTVSDGRLTLTNGPGAVNNKVAYLDVIGA